MATAVVRLSRSRRSLQGQNYRMSMSMSMGIVSTVVRPCITWWCPLLQLQRRLVAIPVSLPLLVAILPLALPLPLALQPPALPALLLALAGFRRR